MKGTLWTSRARIALRVALLVALLGLTSAPTRAATLATLATPVQHSEVSKVLEDEQLLVHSWSPWPGLLTKGYLPIFVELTNTGSETRQVEIEARSRWGSSAYLSREWCAVPAGERQRVELFAPAHAQGSSSYSISVSVDGSRPGMIGQVGASQWASVPGLARAGMYFASRPVDPAALATWALQTSWSTIGNTHQVFTGPAPSHPSSAPAAPLDNVKFGAATFEDLATRFESYTSLDFVVLDVSGEPPLQTELEPLFTWVREGGTLLLLGANSQRVTEMPEVASWVEPRFRRARPASIPTYSMGLGRLLWPPPAEAFADQAHVRGLQLALQETFGWVPSPGGAGSSWEPMAGVPTSSPFPELVIPRLDEVPYPGFTLLLILFTLLIGPLNFALIRRLARPQLLLLTIPVIAALATGSVLAYGILHQGLDVKAAVHSISIVDQRADDRAGAGHRATTVSERLVFAGLAAGQFNPEHGSVVFANLMNRRPWDPQQLEVDLRDSTQLIGDFLPARRRVEQVVLSDRPARLRLEVRTAQQNLEVTNGLGVSLSALAVRDAEGTYYLLPGGLEPDQTAILEPAPPGAGPTRIKTIGLAPELTRLDEEPGRLLPATWIALAAENPLLDDGGVPTNELAGEHHLLGILEQDPEAWR